MRRWVWYRLHTRRGDGAAWRHLTVILSRYLRLLECVRVIVHSFLAAADELDEESEVRLDILPEDSFVNRVEQKESQITQGAHSLILQCAPVGIGEGVDAF